MSTVTSDLYQGYKILDKDGNFLCFCAKKKIDWYMSRSLAYTIDDYTIQLLFDIKKENEIHPYYKQIIPNRCVVCGVESNLNKHHVIPSMFRRCFPLEFKENQHHDIVPTCVDCHESYEREADKLKEEFAAKYAVNKADWKRCQRILAARFNLAQLDSNGMIKGHKIPIEKVQSWYQLACQNVEINEASWTKKVVDEYLSRNDLFSFVKLWRAHFLEHAKPRYLPSLWDVEHPITYKK